MLLQELELPVGQTHGRRTADGQMEEGQTDVEVEIVI